MPVIINDLEVITEPPPPAPGSAGDAAPPATSSASAPAVSPEDVDAILCHRAERAARLYAG